MSAKKIMYDYDDRDAVRAGVKKPAYAEKVTRGPRGRNVILNKTYGPLKVAKDGVTVTKEIELESRFANMGAQMVKEIMSRTSDVTGDGTTTATVLAQVLANMRPVQAQSSFPLRPGDRRDVL